MRTWDRFLTLWFIPGIGLERDICVSKAHLCHYRRSTFTERELTYEFGKNAQHAFAAVSSLIHIHVQIDTGSVHMFQRLFFFTSSQSNPFLCAFENQHRRLTELKGERNGFRFSPKTEKINGFVRVRWSRVITLFFQLRRSNEGFVIFFNEKHFLTTWPQNKNAYILNIQHLLQTARQRIR